MRRELSAQEFALVVAIAVSAKRTRKTRRQRAETEYIDDCIALIRDGPLCPSVIKYNPAGVDHGDLRRRKLCAETLAYFEEVAPLIRMLERA